MTTTLLLLLLTACGGGGGGSGTPNPGPLVTPPSITTQPQNQSAVAGDPATFSVTASGTAPLQYQWRRNGTAIAAATAATLSLPSVALADDGASFTVVVTNSAGSVTSASALLTVTAPPPPPPPPPPTPPSITAQQQAQTALAGGSATFSVTAAGTAPLQYQWRRAGVDIAGANSTTLTLASLTLADNGASFSVVVSNVAGSLASAAAVLTVTAPPSITQEPQSLAVTMDDNASFSVTATGTPPLLYQWRRNGVDLPGATGATLGLTAVTLAMSGEIYSVVVSNALGSRTSANAVLTVNPPPVTAATLALEANDLIYDRLRNRVYASVPATGRIAIIDPTTATIGASIPVGNNPGVLAISGDGRYLYVGLQDDPQVKRIDLDAGSVDLTIVLGAQPPPFTPFAEDIEVLPGSPHSIAVSQKWKTISPRFAGIAVFDDAVERAQKSSSLSGPIEFGASANRLYGYDNQTSAYSLHRMTVSAAGLLTQDTQMNLIRGIDVDVKYDSGFMFSTSGSLIDPEALTLLGSFPVVGTVAAELGAAAAVRPDMANDRVYFLANPAATWQVQGFDTATFTPSGSLDSGDDSASAGSLVRCGFNGLAFRTSEGRVHIVAIESLQAPPAPPDPGPGAMSLTTNDLAYDAARGLIYASIPGKVHTNGNSVAAIDPVTETVLHYVFVGSEPNKLALSDDAQYLYVSLDGAPLIRRIRLSTFTNDQTVALSAFGRGMYVDDMKVLPGNHDSIAVARKSCCFTPRQLGIAVYDNGARRTNATMGFNDSSVIAFGSSASRLYGYDPVSSFEYGLRRMTVTATGVVVDDVTSALITGDASELKYDGGLIFVQALAVNPEALTVARTFAVTGAPISVAPESASNRAYILTSTGGGAWRIESFETSSPAKHGAVAITDGAATASSLIRWGADGLAFRTAADRIHLRRIGDLQ